METYGAHAPKMHVRLGRPPIYNKNIFKQQKKHFFMEI